MDLSEALTHGIAGCLQAGAKLLGGCCGTAPEHIRAVACLINKGG